MPQEEGKTDLGDNHNQTLTRACQSLKQEAMETCKWILCPKRQKQNHGNGLLGRHSQSERKHRTTAQPRIPYVGVGSSQMPTWRILSLLVQRQCAPAQGCPDLDDSPFHVGHTDQTLSGFFWRTREATGSCDHFLLFPSLVICPAWGWTQGTNSQSWERMPFLQPKPAVVVWPLSAQCSPSI